MIFNSYLEDSDTGHFSQYPGPQKMAWVQLVQKYVSVAQQKIFKVVQRVQNRHINTEPVQQLHVVSQKGQLTQVKHCINMTITSSISQGSSFRADVSAWHCPVSHNPTVRRAKGSKNPGQCSDSLKSISAMAQLKFNVAAGTAMSEDWIGTSA